VKRFLAFLVILVVMVSAWTSVSLAGQRNQLRQRVTRLEEKVAQRNAPRSPRRGFPFPGAEAPSREIGSQGE
jgi:hypothetical protein